MSAAVYVLTIVVVAVLGAAFRELFMEAGMSEVDRYKRLARKSKMRMHQIGQHFDCGDQMMRYFNREYAAAAETYDAAVAWLKENDPDFPRREHGSTVREAPEGARGGNTGSV